MENLNLEKENTSKDIRNLFRLEKETKEIKDRILETLRIFLSMNKKVIFGVTIILNLKVMVIEIKLYQLKNILIKLGHVQKTS